MIRNILSVLLWVPAFAVRMVFILLGLVAVPLTKPDNPIWGNNEHPIAPSWFMSGKSMWLRDYVWRALRNPANNLRFLIEEPEIEEYHGWREPENAVRSRTFDSAWRFARSGLYSEYWRVWRTSDGEIAELRLGFKFSEVPGFGFTMQWRKGD